MTTDESRDVPGESFQPTRSRHAFDNHRVRAATNRSKHDTNHLSVLSCSMWNREWVNKWEKKWVHSLAHLFARTRFLRSAKRSINRAIAAKSRLPALSFVRSLTRSPAWPRAIFHVFPRWAHFVRTIRPAVLYPLFARYTRGCVRPERILNSSPAPPLLYAVHVPYAERTRIPAVNTSGFRPVIKFK